MKIGVWLNSSIFKELGGSFSYTSELIKLIDNYNFSDELDIVFVGATKAEYSFKKQVFYLETLEDSNIKNNRKLPLFNKFRKKNILNKNQSWTKQLKQNEIDVLYYTDQHPNLSIDYPFIATNWDIGHLSMEAFPEVTNNGDFEYRNDWYNNKIRKALGIIVESEAGKEELVKFVNLNESRVYVMPIFPLDLLSIDSNENLELKYLKSVGLTYNKYFFYPAQFWAHKNHITLLKAFNKFLKMHPNYKLVLTGSDQGNLKNVLGAISKMGLKLNVVYLGFVNKTELVSLYKNCISLIMPTFLGPTNMPVLEARDLKCPVICSDLKGHREQLEDGAIYINPYNFESILEAMETIISYDNRESLLLKANKIKENSKFNSKTAINSLDKIFMDLKKVVDCWTFK